MARSIDFADNEYPPLLREIPLPPKTLYIEGALPTTPAVAIVGTRKGTKEGLRLAQEFGESLAKEGIAVISGLALGIDAAAHRGALQGKGKTFAVLAGDVAHIYPRQNENLAREILKNGGGIISEYEKGMPTLPQNFLARNRIVSGLSQAVVVIEAPFASGTQSTVRFALEQNREVCVVPGPITHPNYKGSNAFIKDGAHLVTSASDVLEIIGFETKKDRPKKDSLPNLTVDQEKIIRSVRESIRGASIDDLCEATGLSPAEIAQTVTSLIMSDILHEYQGRYIVRS